MVGLIPVRCRGVSKSFDGTAAVSELDLDLVPGGMLSLLGPSGCGKTTILRLIAGLERPDAGSIEIDGRLVSGPEDFVSPERRGIGIVFQDYALFPNRTVEGNVGYALGRRPDPARVAEELARVGLGSLAGRYPHQLSGGEQQRVALARALVAAPAVVLLDEPLSNLDASLRDEMRQELRSLLHEVGVTSVLVTHDQEEALSMSDRVAVMNRGRIEQVGDPREVYLRPAGEWVAEFLGEINRVEGIVSDGRCECELGKIPVSDSVDGPASLLVRPESLTFVPDAMGVAARVVSVEYSGPSQLVTVRLSGGRLIKIREVGYRRLDPGSMVTVGLDGPVMALTSER